MNIIKQVGDLQEAATEKVRAAGRVLEQASANVAQTAFSTLRELDSFMSASPDCSLFEQYNDVVAQLRQELAQFQAAGQKYMEAVIENTKTQDEG